MTAIPQPNPPYAGTIGRLTEDCKPAPLALDVAPDNAPNVVWYSLTTWVSERFLVSVARWKPQVSNE